MSAKMRSSKRQIMQQQKMKSFKFYIVLIYFEVFWKLKAFLLLSDASSYDYRFLFNINPKYLWWSFLLVDNVQTFDQKCLQAFFSCLQVIEGVTMLYFVLLYSWVTCNTKVHQFLYFWLYCLSKLMLKNAIPLTVFENMKSVYVSFLTIVKSSFFNNTFINVYNKI